MKGGLLPLLISPIYTSVATSVLYAHPHISRGSIESFIKCAQLPSKHNDVLAKKQMVRHLTIRPTLVEPNGDNPTIHPVHPSFSQLTLLVPFLQSFTLKDTLVLDIADAENLFSGLRHIQPRKARIELRMWNLHGTAVGADLMAATKPNIHARGFPVQKEKWGYGRESSWLQAIANTRDYDMPAVWLDPRPPNDPNNPNPAAPAAHNIPANLAQQQGAATFAATVAGNRRLATLMARYNGQPGSSRLHSRLRTLSSGNHAALGAAVALSSSDDWLGLSNDSDDSEDSDDGGPDAEHHDADEEGNRSSRSHGGRQRRRRGLSAPPTAPETSGSSTGPGAHAGAGAGPSVSQSAATVESDDTRSAEARPARLDAVDRLTGPVGQATDWTSLDQFDNIEDLDEDQLDLLRQVFDECRSTGADLRNHPCALIRKLPGPAPPSTIHTQAQSTSGGADAIGSDSVAAQSIATPGSSTTATQATSAPQVGPAQVNEPAPQSHRMTGQSGPDEAEIPPVMFSVVATDHDHETEGPAQEELLPPAIVNGSDAGPTTTQNQSPTQISAPDGLSIPAGPLPPNHWSHRERALTVAQRGRTDHIYYPPADDDFPPLAGPSNSTASDNNINNRPRSLLASRPAPPGPNPTPAVARVLADTGALSQSVRGMLLKLLTGHWAESVNAFSFVAFDPAASLAVRAPALDFWTEVPINHIRVHLPLGVNSLAVFKGAKQNARDRLRNRAAALAAAAAAGDDADGSASPDPYGHGARLDALLAGGEEDDEEVVGGDGAGGGLVHPSNRLFEIEVNTVREMQDDMWARAGSQLPPQVCRILLGEQDWASVRTGTFLSFSRLHGL